MRKTLWIGIVSAAFIVAVVGIMSMNTTEKSIKSPRLMVNVKSAAGFSPQEFADAASAKLIELDKRNPYKSILPLFYNESFVVITPELNEKSFGALAKSYGYRSLSLEGKDLDEAVQQAKSRLDSIPKFSSEIPYMSSDTAIEIYDLMGKVDRVLTSSSIKYWASGGTLLGAIRHQGLIPWDDDLDICVLDTDEHKLNEINEKLDRESLAIHHYFKDFYKIYKKDGMPISDIENPGKFFTYTFPFVDVFIFTLERNKESEDIYAHRSQMCYYAFNQEKYAYSQIANLSSAHFGPMMIPIPSNPENVLNALYGMPGRPDIWKKVALEPTWNHKSEQSTYLHGAAFVEIDDYSTSR